MRAQSCHTAPITDAYMTGLRLRNAARVQCAIEQLGDRWLLHPDNAVTTDEYREFRRARVERIDTSRLEAAGFCSLSEAFGRVATAFASARPMLIQHEGGAQ